MQDSSQEYGGKGRKAIFIENTVADWVENSSDLLHGGRCKCLFEGVRINVINKYGIFTYIADCDFCTASAAADKP